MTKQYCPYYQATVRRDKIWLVTGILRNEPHWVFDRTLDAEQNVLEFFVAPAYEDKFIDIMDLFTKKGFVSSCEKKPNRLKESDRL